MQNYDDNMISVLTYFYNSIQVNDNFIKNESYEHSFGVFKLVEIHHRFLVHFMKMCPIQLNEKKQQSFCRFTATYSGMELHNLT